MADIKAQEIHAEFKLTMVIEIKKTTTLPTKVFHKVKHVDLFKIMSELDINCYDLRLIRIVYWYQPTAISIEGEVNWFKLI